MCLGALSGHECVCPSSPRTSTEQVRFACVYPKDLLWAAVGLLWASQGTSRHISLSTKQRLLNAFLTPVGIIKECQPMRAVTGHNSGPTRFARQTWSWFTPAKSSVLSGMVLWNSLSKGRRPSLLLYLREEMSPVLACLFHHRLWRCCSSLLLAVLHHLAFLLRLSQNAALHPASFMQGYAWMKRHEMKWK